MLHVLDDALTEAERVVVRDYFLGFGASTGANWADGSFKDIVSYGSPLSKILSITSKYVDLASMVGCEYWSHLGTKTDWHKDTDEVIYLRDGVEKFPLCSCVYYADINGLSGGDLVFKTMRVAPLTNRLVIFSPSMLHKVENFQGKRLSVAVNPWNYKLELACH